jgi:dolichol kinase
MKSQDIRLQDELVRKSIHVTSLWIPLGYMFLPRKQILIPLGVIVVIALVVEALRTFWPFFENVFESMLGSLLRPRERKNLTGATTMFISAFLCIFFFEKWIAILALFLMLISDALGALVGRFWGKHYYREDRAVEGSLAFLVSGLIMIYFVPEANHPVAIAGVFVALFFEVGFVKLDDNFVVPIGSGVVMELIRMVFLT